MEVAAASGASSFGKYTLVAKLATGGMAEIFLARLLSDGGFEKLVCIKRILPHLAKDPQFVAMFLDEARVVARISHPNVCQVFELGEIGGQYYIAMEYLAGVPLTVFRRPDYYPSAPEIQLVAAFGVQACEGLHHAHQLKTPSGELLGVVHRDISPQNLFVTSDGIIKVLDFGIAKVQDQSAKTSTGALKGTYCYMAPEQLRGERVDRRVDVWALGAVLWECLTQRHLFKRETEFLTFQAITAEPIPHVCELRPDVPPLAGDAIARALSRDREERFPTARAFGEALAQAVAPLGGARTAAQIADVVENAFHTVLTEQHQLLEHARRGDNFDLEKSNPLGGAHARTTSTPVSNLQGKIAQAQAEVAQYVRAQQVIRAIEDEEHSSSGFTPPPGWRARAELEQPKSGVTIVPSSLAAPRRDSTLRRAERVVPDEELPPPPQVSLRGHSRLPWIIAIATVSAAAIVTAWMAATRPGGDHRAAEAGSSVTMATVATGSSAASGAAGVAGTASAAAGVAGTASAANAAGAAGIADAGTVGGTTGAPRANAAGAPPNVAATEEPKPAPKPRPKPIPHEAAAPSGPPGFITIDSTPVYATIYIDGKSYGETPLVHISVPPGHHTVKAVSPSGGTRTSSITIESGKTAPVRRIEW